MNRITGFERDINKLEKNIEKQQETIQVFSDLLYHKKISGDAHSDKKNKIVSRIGAVDSRMRFFQSLIVNEKRRLEEKKRLKEHT
jgi:uncharacterized coiled-coil protein SlyX